MKSKLMTFFGALAFVASSLFATNALAAQHKVVIQVTSNDPVVQKTALNVAVNLQKLYGMDNIDIEVVAFGPGLGIMTVKNPESKRVSSLAQSNVNFKACGNTMAKIEKKTGKKPVLTEGVEVVPAGAARIIELQEQGYSYLKP